MPAYLDNDANVAGLAEARVGAGKGLPVVFYTTLSTGIGGAVVVNGQTISGKHGFGGEIANMNKSKLTLWQACEIHLQEGVLLAALSDMGLFGKIICLFWDRRSNQLLNFESTLSSQDTIIAPSLMNGAIAYAHGPPGGPDAGRLFAGDPLHHPPGISGGASEILVYRVLFQNGVLPPEKGRGGGIH